MKAAVLHRFRDTVTVEEVADPICPSDGVIVTVKACGVCRSDHMSLRALSQRWGQSVRGFVSGTV